MLIILYYGIKESKVKNIVYYFLVFLHFKGNSQINLRVDSSQINKTTQIEKGKYYFDTGRAKNKISYGILMHNSHSISKEEYLKLPALSKFPVLIEGDSAWVTSFNQYDVKESVLIRFLGGKAKSGVLWSFDDKFIKIKSVKWLKEYLNSNKQVTLYQINSHPITTDKKVINKLVNNLFIYKVIFIERVLLSKPKSEILNIVKIMSKVI